MSTPSPGSAPTRGGQRERAASTSTSGASPRARISPLFLRIYASFVVTVLVFAALVGLLVWTASSSWSEQRVLELIDRADASGEPLAEALLAKDEAQARALADALSREIDAHVTIFPRLRGRRLGPPIGPPPRHGHHPHLNHTHPLTKAEAHHLRMGQPLVRRSGLGPPTIGLALFERGFFIDPELDELGQPVAELDDDAVVDGGGDGGRRRPRSPGARERAQERGRFIAVVAIDPKHNPRRGLLGIGALLLVALAGGAWPLARSLSSRLAKLERSTRVLADGELGHRAELAREPRDEIDRLALSFNEMAERLETLVTGQRTLLANVSHELRTPIARTKVLLEILGERVESMTEAKRAGEALAPADLARLERGFAEMQEDLDEVEGLIEDLLTSGRLELGRDGVLVLEPIDLAELCSDAATRFDARVECEQGLTLDGDRMLLERLIKNLLANARRACPAGELLVRGQREGSELVIEVEDEGPGIPADKRTQIFEPFARLDAARARDQGGVGLGLYLCRQIAAAHGGSIRAEDRLDGRAGARFVIQLPRPGE